MRKFLIGGSVLVLLALDWAALHDILKANEPDLFGEYAILMVSAAVFALLVWMVWHGTRTPNSQ